MTLEGALRGEGVVFASVGSREHFERGRVLLEEGQPADAFLHLEAAHRLDPRNPRYRSYYGLGLALAERRFEQGLDLCQSAVREEFFNPDLYLNLARLHLAFGFKAEGLRHLRRGLMLDPSHAGLRAELERLGRRRRPVLRFLPRRHALNRWSGRLRSLLRRAAATG